VLPRDIRRSLDVLEVDFVWRTCRTCFDRRIAEAEIPTG
jgi:hypothetical protein